MGLQLITAPTSEPFSIDEAKAWMRQDQAKDDKIIQRLIREARQNFDGPTGVLGRAILTQSWRYTLDYFPACDCIPIPLPPLQEVTAVKYVDGNGVTQTLASNQYRVLIDEGRGRLERAYQATFPDVRCQSDAVLIEFRCGYTLETLDERIKQAMKSRMLFLYDNREEQRTPPEAEDLGPLIEWDF